MIDLLSEGFNDRQQAFHGVLACLLRQLETHSSHFHQQKDKWKGVNLDMDCESDHMHILHHNGNIDNFLNQQRLRYGDNYIIRKVLHKELEFKKIKLWKDIVSFSIGITTVEAKYANGNSNYLYSNNMAK